MCASYRGAILVVFLITNAGTSQNSLDKLRGSLLDIDDQDSETLDKRGSVSEAFRQKVSAKTDSPPSVETLSSNILTRSDLHTVVLSRFMKEMGSLFVTLPVNTQCRELLKVTETASCNSLTLQNWTSLRTNISKCSWHGKDTQQSKTCNRTAFIKVFQQQMGQVFDSLSWPFKCNIVNLVAQTYKVSRGQVVKSQATISVQDAQDAIEKIFHFIHIQQSCSKAMIDVVLPQVSMIRLKIVLNNGTTKETWLKNFTTKGPDIYKIYLTYQQKSDKRRPLIGTSIRRPLPAVVPPSQIYVKEVSEGMQEFSVVFGLKIKKKGYFRVMKSSHKIVSSLRSVKEDEFNALLQAKVLRVELTKEQVATSTPSDGRRFWTASEMQRATSLFPENMTGYYKQVGLVERCFIMFQISSSLGRTPAETEKLFNALKQVIRRHACYYTNRNGILPVPGIPIIVGGEREGTTPPSSQTTHPASEDADVSSKRTPYPGGGQGQNKQPVEGGDSEVSSLEYALFILLGLLCIATLAFTINYALFALRRSPNRTNRHPPNGMLPLEVVRQTAKKERACCVHATHNNQTTAKQEQQLPLAFTKSSLTRNDSGMPCASRATQSFVSDLGTAGSGTDSGYSQSQETSSPSHGSAITRNLHSDTELCGQISGKSKSLGPETELYSEAKTSEVNVSPNPDASVDLECRANSVASCLDSSNIQSPSQEPEGYHKRCSTVDSQDSEPSCTQSYETGSPEDPCETLHVLFDHGGIKEVQV